MDRTDVIQTIADTIIDVPGVRGLFLSGSHGNGMADTFSDIDFIMIAEEGASDAVAAVWHNAVSQTGEIVLWWDRTKVPVLINAITADWTRTDVVILRPNQLGSHSKAELKPVFDHDNLFDNLTETTPENLPNPAKLRYQIEEFIRILGLLNLAAGREEYINGVLGVFHLRNLLVDIMVEETNAPNRGGILHLNRLITAEQKSILTALPPAIPNRDAMISAHVAYAQVYLPIARKRAKTLGVEWPTVFEAATWAHLKKTLSIECPY